MASLEYQRAKDQLLQALKDKREIMEKAAQAKMVYKVAFAKKEMELKAEGVNTTILKEQAEGSEDIAQLRFEWDKAEILVECNQEAINVKKIEVKGLQDEDNREWRLANDTM